MIEYIEDELLVNKEFVVGGNPITDQLTIRNSDITKCKFAIMDPRTLRIICANIVDSVFHMNKRGALRCHNVQFENCVFTGRYYDAEFGIESHSIVHCSRKSELNNCDFSKAKMHFCAIFNSDPATIIFPKWPHITILYPRRNSPFFLEIPFPSVFAAWKEVVSMSNEKKSSLTFHWPTLAKSKNDMTDPELIRQLLIDKYYIVM